MTTLLPSKWFRMYAEFATDPKVQMLSEQDQRRYIMLLCLRCSNGSVTLHDSEVAFQLRITEQDWLSTKAVLLSKCLITDDSKPTAWDKRQFASDSSAARVAEHRAKRKADMKRYSNALEAEAEAEEEKERLLRNAAILDAAAGKGTKQKLSGFAEFWSLFPKKRNKGDAEKAWKAINPDEQLQADIMAAVIRAMTWDDWLKSSGKFIPYPASWLRAKGWEDGAATSAYSEETLSVIATYNATMQKVGWPDASETPFLPERESAVTEFLTFSTKPDWVDRYFAVVASEMTPFNGCGFDWLVKKETFVKIKEGVFSGSKA